MKALYNTLDWLDTHRDAMVLVVFILVLVLLFWTNSFGPPSPPSDYAPHFNLYIPLSAPLPLFFDGYQPLPSPKPEDCIIVPLENQEMDHTGSYLVITT